MQYKDGYKINPNPPCLGELKLSLITSRAPNHRSDKPIVGLYLKISWLSTKCSLDAPGVFCLNWANFVRRVSILPKFLRDGKCPEFALDYPLTFVLRNCIL